MYIYLDESYNLAQKEKKQFISINGFMVLNERFLFKRWKQYRQPFANKKRRIHATDSWFSELRKKTLKLLSRPDLTLLSVFQVIQEINPRHLKKYYYKNKLNFDQLYFDLLKILLLKLNLEEYRQVNIIIDSRKVKGGILGKKTLEQELLDFLQNKFKQTAFQFKVQPSHTDILLELADFISNIFYRAYQEDKNDFFVDLRFKMVQIKNPLK